MIKKVRIRNFQKHSDTVLCFDEGVNVITGESDQGKSSILRAIGWALYNRPSGFWFRSWKAIPKDKTSVRIRFDDGVVERRRNNSENAYKVGKLVLKAVKSDVPEEVSTVAKVDDRNFQGQHDGYFLIQNSAGEVARKLNEVIGIDVIDKSLKRASSIVSSIVAKERALKEQQEEIKKSLKELEFVDELDSLFRKARKKIELLDICKKRIETLWSLSKDLAEIIAGIDEEEQWLKVENQYNNVMNKLRVFEEVEKKKESLIGLISMHIVIDKQTENQKSILDETSMKYQWLEEKWDQLSDLLRRRQELNQSISVLNKLKEKISEVVGYIGYAEKAVKVKEHKFVKIMREAGVCPLCGSETGTFSIKKVAI